VETDGRQEVTRESIKIAPFQNKAEIKGAFLDDKNPDYAGLINYIRTVAWSSQREKKSRTYLIYFHDSLVGYLTVSSVKITTNIPGPEPQAILLGRLYIDEKLRGNGIGTKAIEFVVDLALRMDELMGCAGIMLHANVNSVGFYKALGFNAIEGAGEERAMFFPIAR